ncbi:MAG: CoA-acylating methylmalonate-semialdehyde dehydrogenase [Bdellovibrionaceae bacterium]|nr:CoA-acylating methylmalonate-semialdehyde dehydrogenase [Pseudobdellovibrionaceae bacterium]
MFNQVVQDYYDGRWTLSSGTSLVPILNPATGETIGNCPLGADEDVGRAVRAAHLAFGEWCRVPAIERVQYLFKLKPLLESAVEELAKLVTLEHGKTLAEARASVKRGIQMIDTATGMPSFQKGEFSEDIARGVDCLTIRQPLGVFAGIAPFNFPAMVPFWFWPFAIAAGNTFVLKPSERVPLTHQLIFDLIDRVGLPKGVMNLVHGGREVVTALCTHPDIKGVSFVGSTPVAKYVYTTAGAHGKRVQALGGAKNFMVVLPDAIIDKSVATALESIIGCAGERCLAGSVLICVGNETYQKVKDQMTIAAQNVIVGDGMDPSVQMGPVISNESKLRIMSLIQSAEDQGAELLVDGRQEFPHNKKGFFLRPSVIAQVTEPMRVAQEEIFGPVVLLAQTKTLEEAIGWINRSAYANTTTLFTSNGSAARKFCSEVAPSMIGINIGVPAPMSFFSFGGSKDSFFGDIKAYGAGSVNFFTEEKIITQRWMSDSSVW